MEQEDGYFSEEEKGTVQKMDTETGQAGTRQVKVYKEGGKRAVKWAKIGADFRLEEKLVEDVRANKRIF